MQETEKVPTLKEICFDAFQQNLHPVVQQEEMDLNILDQIKQQLEEQKERTKNPNTKGRTKFTRNPSELVSSHYTKQEERAWCSNTLLGTLRVLFI
jgi:hypothetical protein